MIIRNMMKDLGSYILLKRHQEQWKKKNTHNSTLAGTHFPIDRVKVGNGTYGTLNIHCFQNPSEYIEIGNYCCIADDVHILTGGEHDYKKISCYPFRRMLNPQDRSDAITKGAVIIEDDVWIGYGAIILSGTHIHQGGIIGAGSVVRGDIPPYSIFAGGRIIKKRFSDEVIEKLQKMDYHSFDRDVMERNIDALYKNVSPANIDDLMNALRLS